MSNTPEGNRPEMDGLHVGNVEVMPEATLVALSLLGALGTLLSHDPAFLYAGAGSGIVLGVIQEALMERRWKKNNPEGK